MSEANVLFSDVFEIKDIDPDGKRFDRGTVLAFAFPPECLPLSLSLCLMPATTSITDDCSVRQL